MATSPHVRALRLAREMRKLRQDAGLTAEQLAKKIRVSRVKLTQLETAARRPDIGDVMNLLDRLEITGSKFNEIVRVARDAAERGWWEERRFKEMGDRQAHYANLEYGADRIREYAMAFMPGLLQTEDFMRARSTLVPARTQTTWNVEGAAHGRLERQRAFAEGDARRLEVIAEEVVIRRPTAPPHIMAKQLERVIDAIKNDPKVSFRVLPIEADMTHTRQVGTTFYIHSYPDRQDPTVVTIEAVHRDVTLIDPNDVDRYERLWERMDELALPESKTVDLLTRTVKQFAS